MADHERDRPYPTTEGEEMMTLVAGLAIVMVLFYLVLEMEELVNGK